MDETQQIEALVRMILWAGFGLGLLFGAIASKTNFCTMGAVSDVVNMGDWGRMRAWFLAIAVAIIGTQLLGWAGLMDTAKTFYTTDKLPWVAHLVGGLTFGIGMTLASGCGNKTLLRVGTGNLKSLVVLIFMAFSAILTLRGAFAPLRIFVLQAEPLVTQLPTAQSVPHLLFAYTGITLANAQWLSALLIGGALLAFVFLNRSFIQEKDNVLAGLVLGAIVVLGWYITAHLALAENPDTLEVIVFGTSSKQAESITFIGPVAQTFELLQRWTDKTVVVTWGIAAALGVLCGAFLYAQITRTFRWEGFTTSADLIRHILGGLLMGFGGVTAIGCTIGQGLTGVSTLSIGSVITLLSIILGSALTMKYEYWRMMREV